MTTENYKKSINDLLESKNKTKILLISLISIPLIIVIYFLFFYSSNEINILKKQDDKLLNQNKVLDSLNTIYMVEIKKKDSTIGKLINQDNLLKIKVLSVDSKIKAINYEKANSHSDNFGSEQLRRYFADSLR